MYLNEICTDCGATVKRGNQTQHTNWHLTFIHRSEVKDGFNMSMVKWCDIGQHAFKAGAAGSQSLDVTQRDEFGMEERVTMDMCVDHAFQTAVSSNPTMRAVETAYRETRQNES